MALTDKRAIFYNSCMIEWYGRIMQGSMTTCFARSNKRQDDGLAITDVDVNVFSIVNASMGSSTFLEA